MRELGDVLRVRKLGWFGHVVRREEREILGKTQHVVTLGRQPPGRLKKDLEKKYAGRTCKSKLAGGAGVESRSVEACHQPSHLMKMSSQDVKRKK